MTYTSRVRYLDPVDPRKIWEIGRRLVLAPADYTVFKYRDYWIADSEQGAWAMLIMYFGPEGTMIDNRFNEAPDAYVELVFDSCTSMDGVQRIHAAWHMALFCETDAYRGRMRFFDPEIGWHKDLPVLVDNSAAGH
jgi:hypothetical protein